MNHAISGVFAAVATPVQDDGRPDLDGLDRLVEFLLASGVDGLCVGGATGEYPHFEAADRASVIRHVARRMPRDRALVVGIGAASVRRTIDLGAAAMDAGSRALLLPMPMFFRYEQDDLRAYCAHVSGTLAAPCLLYDLPDFTNGLAPSTVIALIRDEPFIVGIKDSSGRAANLEAFVAVRASAPGRLLVGYDRLLYRGLQAGWDGGISGVAGFCPELLVAIHRRFVQGRTADAELLDGLLAEMIARLGVFPTPWGIRIGLEARGIPTGPLPLPVTSVREAQIAEFHAWLPAWLERLQPLLRAR